MGIPQPANKYSCTLTSPGVGKTSQLIASPATAANPESQSHSRVSKLASTPACSGVFSAAYFCFRSSENVFHSEIAPVRMKRMSPRWGTRLCDEHMAFRTLRGIECVEKQLQVLLFAAAQETQSRRMPLPGELVSFYKIRNFPVTWITYHELQHTEYESPVVLQFNDNLTCYSLLSPSLNTNPIVRHIHNLFFGRSPIEYSILRAR